MDLGVSAADLNNSLLFNYSDSIRNDTSLAKLSPDSLNVRLRFHLQGGDMSNSSRDVGELISRIRAHAALKGESYSTSCYLVGIYWLFSKNYGEAIHYLKAAASVKEKRKELDEQYAKTIYNIGIAYNGLGDIISQEQYTERSLELEKVLYGDSSPQLIKTYLSLVIANINLKDYEKALGSANKALFLADNNPGSADLNDLASIYNNLGVLYLRKSDYSKAKVYLEKSESLHKQNKDLLSENYFNILNSLAIAYDNLGLKDKSDDYFRKGIDSASSSNTVLAYNFINSYAIELANRGKKSQGDSLLNMAVEQVKSKSGGSSQLYYTVLYYYADYLSTFGIDNTKAIRYYRECVDYLKRNNRNTVLREMVYLGYSSALAETGNYYKALDVIQSLLIPERGPENEIADSALLFKNPSVASLKSDRSSLKILKLKYGVLWKTFVQTHDIKMLETASATSKLIVEVLEKVRINISEEDSRLILGDRYRDSYLNAIHSFNMLYHLTGNPAHLENAFEFSEKSKVAGLLTATRELNASQFNIPPDLTELERKLKRDLNIRSARIDEEMQKEHPDTFLINSLKESILRHSSTRDSLIDIFEKKYPGYYAFKYNTSVIKMDDIPHIVGRNVNYISYVASDSILYVFIANRKYHQLLSIAVDSSLYKDIRQFRVLLGMPSPSDNARENFNNFQTTGFRLYRKILEPLRPYLISDKLVISPDNLLSYIPFETIPTSLYKGDRILYNRIPYLMNEFDISYTYSATFLEESVKKGFRLSNKLVAFAPSYSEPIDIGTVMKSRQTINGTLPDLPYARQEAEYVSTITGGKLYENDQARETVFKNESGKYDIIHLAMHTVLNDREPMYSTLIFSPETDSVNDRYLKTYEIYSIPLRARMVVLSSCNSGSGLLFSGEGILSLARGFIYSGSESVVMAMWEIEDKSGTDIVKGFYDNLKKGYSKSYALREARLEYLQKADQLRSHPYFWSSLVVYGDNDPLYFSKRIYLIPGIAGALILFFTGYYFWRRRYS